MTTTSMRMLNGKVGLFCLFLLFGRKQHGLTTAASPEPLSNSLTPDELESRDPALHEMTYDVGEGIQSTWVYKEPDITTFYALDDNPPASTKVTPMFQGFAGKFINLSNQRLTLYWEDKPGGKLHPMRNHNPFTASGTATFPGHRFVFTPENDSSQILIRFIVSEYPDNLYYYDPYHVEGDEQKSAENLMQLTPSEQKKYARWVKTLMFNKQYKEFTGRSYLANYLRDPPKHHMWRAEYFGQDHWITTRETHFVDFPPEEELDPINVVGEKRVLKDDDPRILQNYRDPSNSILNMTLVALSVAPRVFSVPNFLSEVEVMHIRSLADTYELKLSKTGQVNAGEREVKEDSRRTRTSRNTWVPRERSPIVDAVYRRAADLLRIDEPLFRHRGKTEYPNMDTKNPICESLQLVHYDETQEYTAHHDFGYSEIDDDKQSARFATLLLYLNEGMEGGETSFPRWSNAETFLGYNVVPKAGDAVLFYSQLPDGNLDDLSHHSAEPVINGEKWLCNLWVWSPQYD